MPLRRLDDARGAVRQRGGQPVLERVGGLHHVVVHRNHGVAHLARLGLGQEEIVDRHEPEYARGIAGAPRRQCRDIDRPRMDTGTDAEKEAAWSHWSLSRRSWCWCSASWWRACSAAMPTSSAPCTSSAWAWGTPRPLPAPVAAPVTLATPASSPALGAAPAVAGVTPTGDARAVAVDNSDDLTLLGFLSSGCTGCAAFWDALQDPGRLPLPDRTRVVIVTKGPDREVPSEVRVARRPAGSRW